MHVALQSELFTEMVHRIDEAMAPCDDARRCRGVERVLADVVGRREAFLEEPLLRPAPAGYARRLLHRDEAGRYTVMAMVWDRGQGTPLHDHAGIWCVEGVYRGEIEVVSYALRGGDPAEDRVRFERGPVLRAGVGETAHLLPPFEYHEIRNSAEAPAVTIHVYGGDMTHCHVFEPLGGGDYRRVWRDLVYTA